MSNSPVPSVRRQYDRKIRPLHASSNKMSNIFSNLSTRLFGNVPNDKRNQGFLDAMIWSDFIFVVKMWKSLSDAILLFYNFCCRLIKHELICDVVIVSKYKYVFMISVKTGFLVSNSCCFVILPDRQKEWRKYGTGKQSY